MQPYMRQQSKRKDSDMTTPNIPMTSFTGNGAPAHEHSMDHYLEFFSKGGSIRGKETYYSGLNQGPLELFKQAWYAGNKELAMKLLFWCRDCRGGAGSRQTFRDCIKWVAGVDPDWVSANIKLVTEYGRWDDLKSLYGTQCERDALRLWANTLNSDKPEAALAAKWAGRKDGKLRAYMQLNPKTFRKLVVEKTQWVVEHDMCSGKWEDINFKHIPSVAGARYRNAFKKHDETRYDEWCESLVESGEVNAKALFPHDIIRTIYSTNDKDTAFRSLVNALFDNIPDYIEDPTIKIMPVCDFSGSMHIKVSGDISAMDVSLALGMYCSDRLGEDNPFYRKLIPFSSTSKLESWADKDVIDAVYSIPDGYMGSTNLKGALDNLLQSAVMWNVKKDDMVTHVLILSDMQWDIGTKNADEGVVENCMQGWEAAGYDRPTIVYWNLHSYDNQPATKHERDVAMVSGFSPSILKTVLSARDVDPVQIMMEVVSKYTINTPRT